MPGYINLKIDADSVTQEAKNSCNTSPWQIPEELKGHYKEISDSLNKAEAYFFTVGVPCLPFSKKLRELKKQCFYPLEDFIRISLTNVPTPALQSYTEDLQQIPLDSKNSEKLGIIKLTFLERYSLTIFLFASCFGLPLISQSWLIVGSIFPLLISLGLAISVSAISLYICSETYRRSNFYWLLSKEILRRKGLDQPDSGTIPLYAIRTNPNS